MKKNVIVVLVVVLVVVIGFVGVKIYLDKDIDKQKENLEDTINKYGVVTEVTVEESVAKFNTLVMDKNIGNVASDDYFTVDNNLYWYGLIDDVYMYVKPVDFSGNKDKDITNIMTIQYSKNSKNSDVAINYVKALLKANNDKLTDSDIDYLMSEAKNNKKNSNNGMGISVSFVENDEIIEYQVIRLYKQSLIYLEKF